MAQKHFKRLNKMAALAIILRFYASIDAPKIRDIFSVSNFSLNLNSMSSRQIGDASSPSIELAFLLMFYSNYNSAKLSLRRIWQQ